MNSSKNQIGNNVLAKLAPRMPFRLVLVVPFLLQIFATVGIVGYLSYQDSKESNRRSSNSINVRGRRAN